jgi:hypothetical protein
VLQCTYSKGMESWLGTFSIVGATMRLLERYGELGRDGTFSIVGATMRLLERYGELASNI